MYIHGVINFSDIMAYVSTLTFAVSKKMFKVCYMNATTSDILYYYGVRNILHISTTSNTSESKYLRVNFTSA